MRVLNFEECAGRAGIVRRTLERQIAEGHGPRVIEISTRRRGVLESDFDDWLLARRRPISNDPSSPTKRGRGRPRKVIRAMDAQ